jgi:tetratricopeptide (TPR) repeat protein
VTRVRVLVALAALGAAALTVAIVVLTSDPPQERVSAMPPPLYLDFGARRDAEARALREAASLYERGRIDSARAIFDRHRSPEARVGSAFVRWPDETLERLRGLESSAVVVLHRGIALAGLGREREARAELRAVERIDSDSAYAIRAADFLHPRFVPGLPFFVAEGSPRGALRAGIAFQRLGRPVSARRAFRQAVRERPNDPETLTAEAVSRFEKDDPSRAFSRLGPLTRRFPRAQTVRFHLGLLLLWIADVDGARRQLERARALEPSSRLGREASRLLERLGDNGTP